MCGRAWPVRPPSAGNASRACRGHAAAMSRSGAGLRLPGVEQGVQVPAHAGGGDAEPVADLAGGDRSGLQQQLDDLATGMAIDLRTDFHNTIVTEFAKAV